MNPGDNARMVVQDVIYGVAGELQQARIFKEPPMYTYVQSYLRQNWTYNTLFQATRETSVDEEGWISTTVVDLQYSYTAGQNNGRITQRTEAVSGEQVSYTYDSLNRLIAAVTTGPQYGLTWTYDGFGNMTAQQVTKGSGYNNNLSYNGLTNRITTPGYGYDANGNLTAMPALTMQYDVLNRMTSSTPAGGGTTTVYAYGPGGQRVGQSYAPDPNNWQNNMWTIYVYGPDGRRIADCRAGYAPLNPQYPQMNLVFQTSCGTAYVHFRGRLVRMESPPVMQDGVWVDQRGTTTGTDRLGSVHYWENMATTNYYPYGEEETPTWNDKQKFATYPRDSATGLDYAQHRYYASQIGRFTTADPYRASAKRRNPQSWNRYAYVLNDPVNANDPSGLDCDLVGADGQTIGDMDGCGGPSIGWGDDDPGASVDSCQSAAMFGMDGCGATGSSAPSGNSAVPKLQCSNEGADARPAERGTGDTGRFGYYMPVFFDFTATGGTGTYTWSDVQVVVQTGWVKWNNGSGIVLLPIPTIESLPNTDSPTDSSAGFFDAPGWAIAPLNSPGGVFVSSANISWSAALLVTVSSGNQTIYCPLETWSASLNWRTVAGRAVVHGIVTEP